jgi:hypothetical protein
VAKRVAKSTNAGHGYESRANHAGNVTDANEHGYEHEYGKSHVQPYDFSNEHGRHDASATNVQSNDAVQYGDAVWNGGTDGVQSPSRSGHVQYDDGNGPSNDGGSSTSDGNGEASVPNGRRAASYRCSRRRMGTIQQYGLR